MHRELGHQTMLATPEIIQTNAQAAAVIRLTIARSEMMKVCLAPPSAT
jgi:hypothetical protein